MMEKTEFCRLPEEWADWKLKEVIGEGSGGRVYRAENGKGEVSAVKVMEIPADSYEIQALKQLAGCPYIVEVQDSCIEELANGQWRVFLRMECLKSLAELLQERSLSEDEALQMMTDLSQGLERCEQEKILHRDIKPENILITKQGRAKLGDFGVASNQAEGADNRSIRGTFSYMAPESFYGRECDCTADIYSLGMVFYRAMGRKKDSSAMSRKERTGYAVREKALEERMSGASLPLLTEVAPDFARILQKTCAFAPERRYRSASDLRKDLEKCLLSRKSRSGRFLARWSRLQKAAAAAVLLAVICGAAFGIWWRTPLFQEKRPNGFLYTVDRNYTLTVKGDGVLPVNRELTGWMDYRDRIEKLVIKGRVTRMEEQFNMCPGLTEVEFPEGMEEIGHTIFALCDNLEKVRLPSSLKKIGNNVFISCSFLKEATLPEGLESIGEGAFDGCSSLSQVEIPSSVKWIGAHAFADTAWMEEQEKSGKKMLVAGDILIRYFGDEKEVEISADMGIRSIAGWAFSANSTMQSIVIADCVEDIGKGAFCACSALKRAVLPEGLEEIPESLFEVCSSLEHLALPEKTRRIGRCALRGCGKLKKISLPETVIRIGEDALTGTGWYQEAEKENELLILDGFLVGWAKDEAELVIPDDLGIVRIADYALKQKERLERVVLPEGLIEVGKGCFFFCRNLSEIEIPHSLKKIGRFATAGTKWSEVLLRQPGGAHAIVNEVDLSH